MVAVFVHQVVGVSLELLSQLLHYFINVLLCKVCCTQSYSLSVEKTGLVIWFVWLIACVSVWLCKTHLNLKVSPSSEAFPGLISKMPLKGYGWPPYANSNGNKTANDSVGSEHFSDCNFRRNFYKISILHFKSRLYCLLGGPMYFV